MCNSHYNLYNAHVELDMKCGILVVGYTCLKLFSQDNLAKPAPKRHKIFLNFNLAKDKKLAIASDGPHANHLHLSPDN